MTEKLGKGLGALFGDFSFDDEEPTKSAPAPTKAKEENKNDVQKIALSLIDNNIDQPRKIFDPKALEELAESIRNHGVIQPILVTPVGNRYMIVAGERRWRASKLAGVTEIPAVVRMFNVKQIAEIAIIENLQRDDLNDMELAYGIKRLMEEHALTQEKVAERLSKPRSTVANMLRLLVLPSAIKRMIELKQLTSGHAIRLLSLSSENEQLDFAKKAVEENLSVRALGDLIDGKGKAFDFSQLSKSSKSKEIKAPEIVEQEKEMSRKIGTKVKIEGSTQSGKVIIAYHSAQELNRVVEYIKNHKI